MTRTSIIYSCLPEKESRCVDFCGDSCEVNDVVIEDKSFSALLISRAAIVLTPYAVGDVALQVVVEVKNF